MTILIDMFLIRGHCPFLQLTFQSQLSRLSVSVSASEAPGLPILTSHPQPHVSCLVGGADGRREAGSTWGIEAI